MLSGTVLEQLPSMPTRKRTSVRFKNGYNSRVFVFPGCFPLRCRTLYTCECVWWYKQKVYFLKYRLVNYSYSRLSWTCDACNTCIGGRSPLAAPIFVSGQFANGAHTENGLQWAAAKYSQVKVESMNLKFGMRRFECPAPNSFKVLDSVWTFLRWLETQNTKKRTIFHSLKLQLITIGLTLVVACQSIRCSINPAY